MTILSSLSDSYISSNSIPASKKDILKQSNNTVADTSLLDEFISSAKKVDDNYKKRNLITRLCWSPTAIVAGAILPIGYEVKSLIKIMQLKKADDKEVLKTVKKTFKKICYI